MQIRQKYMSILTHHQLRSIPRMRSHRPIHSLPCSNRIIHSRRMQSLRIVLRILRRIRSLDLGQSVRHKSQLVTSSRLKARHRNPNSTSTLPLTSKRLIQMPISILKIRPSPIRRVTCHLTRTTLQLSPLRPRQHASSHPSHVP